MDYRSRHSISTPLPHEYKNEQRQNSKGPLWNVSGIFHIGKISSVTETFLVNAVMFTYYLKSNNSCKKRSHTVSIMKRIVKLYDWITTLYCLGLIIFHAILKTFIKKAFFFSLVNYACGSGNSLPLISPLRQRTKA